MKIEVTAEELAHLIFALDFDVETDKHNNLSTDWVAKSQLLDYLKGEPRMEVVLSRIHCCSEHRWGVKLFRHVVGQDSFQAPFAEPSIFSNKKDAMRRVIELREQYNAEFRENKD